MATLVPGPAAADALPLLAIIVVGYCFQYFVWNMLPLAPFGWREHILIGSLTHPLTDWSDHLGHCVDSMDGWMNEWDPDALSPSWPMIYEWMDGCMEWLHPLIEQWLACQVVLLVDSVNANECLPFFVVWWLVLFKTRARFWLAVLIAQSRGRVQLWISVFTSWIRNRMFSRLFAGPGFVGYCCLHFTVTISIHVQ